MLSVALPLFLAFEVAAGFRLEARQQVVSCRFTSAVEIGPLHTHQIMESMLACQTIQDLCYRAELLLPYVTNVKAVDRCIDFSDIHGSQTRKGAIDVLSKVPELMNAFAVRIVHELNSYRSSHDATLLTRQQVGSRAPVRPPTGGSPLWGGRHRVLRQDEELVRCAARWSALLPCRNRAARPT